MNNEFEPVLSEPELYELLIGDKSICWGGPEGEAFNSYEGGFDIWKEASEFLRVFEQAVLAKLYEQKPIMYARTFEGKIDWDEGCVSEDGDFLLIEQSEVDVDDDGNETPSGYAVIPLYTSPLPTLTTPAKLDPDLIDKIEAIGTASVGILEPSGHAVFINRGEQYIDDSDDHIPDAGKMLRSQAILDNSKGKLKRGDLRKFEKGYLPCTDPEIERFAGEYLQVQKAQP